ncbi:MAG: zinc/manganese transport system substrate-binding protein, partial [Acidimicrobiaceae bacterium]
GASESIVTPHAAALGLRVMTPETYLDAISEGSDPSAADKALVDQQLATKAIKVLVFNAQNATPDVQRLVDIARANGIAVTTVTETLTPQGATFQDWQTRQLQELEAALSTATGT